jgi:hypothetical protein
VTQGPARDAARVLASIAGREMREGEGVVAFDPALSNETAMMIPMLAEAMRAWELMQLEVGAAAVVTPGSRWSPLLELLATWYGARPVSLGTAMGDSEAVSALAATLARFPVVCVAELTGRADVVDMILESVPASSRVLFAGPRIDRFTIDYYVNVHRKGLHLASTVLAASRAFSPALRDPSILERAGRLLLSPTRAAACHAALNTPVVR